MVCVWGVLGVHISQLVAFESSAHPHRLQELGVQRNTPDTAMCVCESQQWFVEHDPHDEEKGRGR